MAYIGNTAASKFVSNRAASVYSGDGSTVAFTLEQVVTQDEDVLVSVDGVVQEPSVAYAVSSGTTLTFTAAPSNNAGNNIFVYYLASQAGTIGHPSSQALSATNGTFTGDVGIGTNAPGYQLDLRRNDTGTVPSLGIRQIGTGDASMGYRTTTSPYGFVQGVDGSDADSFKIAFGTEDVGTNTALKISNAGAVTMPLQPAFLARPASEQSNIVVGSAVTVVFGTEVFDVGANFSKSGGLANAFTAPVTGKYQLNVSVRLNNVDSAANFYRLELVTSNGTYYGLIDPDFGQDAAYWTMNVCVLADMDASDTAIVRVTQGSGTAQTDIDGNPVYTFFSGYLVA